MFRKTLVAVLFFSMILFTSNSDAAIRDEDFIKLCESGSVKETEEALAQKNKLWLIKTIDRRTGKTVAWVLGNRDIATFQRLYDKVKHLTGCTFSPTIGKLSRKYCRLSGM
jgi:hydroxymethylpyrimidine/phosphomethylpyrimidine kinase